MTEQSPPNDIVTFDVRIPKSRIAVLIGSAGSTKKQIQRDTKTKLDIDSEEGDVLIEGKDPVLCFIARDVVKAIGRGFNPDVALYLLKSDYAFELIDLNEDSPSKNSLVRVKGRVIGKEGKSRELIEKLLEVNVSVFGKTIGIIGEIERVSAGRQAVEMLLNGSPHANVYRWLEQKRKVLIKQDMMGQDLQVKDEFKKYL